MDIFGFTPVDAALTAFGLNSAQLIADFIFQTPVAGLVFIAALLLSIGGLMAGNYQPLFSSIFAALTIILLLLPQRSEGTIKSALEHYGQTSQTSQAIKDQIINYHQIPAVLGFFDQTVDGFLIGIIQALDNVTPAWARYLTSPFGVQRSGLYIRENIRQGISDFSLRKDLDRFLHDHYLPALGLLKQRSPGLDTTGIWPGDNRISSLYSPQARQQWAGLHRQLKGRFELDNIANLTQTSPELVDQALVKSVVDHQLNAMVPIKILNWPWRLSLWILNLFPYVYGSANMIMIVFFPFIVLALVLSRRTKLLISYLKTLVWIKSWALASAFSFYVSLLAARLHTHSTDPAWSWQEPYYCLAAVTLLLVMPAITFILINKGGQAWGG